MVITIDITKMDAKVISEIKMTVNLAKIFLGEKSGMAKSLKYMKDKVNTIRLLDIGKDKTLPYLHVHEEQNSVLGLR